MDDPHDLGLPANIGKTAHLAAAANVIGQLRLLQSLTGSSYLSDRSLWAEELSPILGLWKSLNQDEALLPVMLSAHRHFLRLFGVVVTVQYKCVQSMHQFLGFP